MHFIPSHPICLRYILIMFSHLFLGFPCGPFPVLFCPITVTIPTHLIILGFMPQQYLVSTIPEALHLTILSSVILHPSFQAQISCSAHFSQHVLSLCSALNTRDEFSHPYKAMSKMIVCLSFIFVDSKWQDKRFWIAWQQEFPKSAINFSMNAFFICYWNRCLIFFNSFLPIFQCMAQSYQFSILYNHPNREYPGILKFTLYFSNMQDNQGCSDPHS